MIRLKITSSLRRRIRQALREDVGSGDITTNLIVPPDFKIQATLVTRESGVVCGLPLLPEIFKRSKVRMLKKEGSWIKPNTVVAKISGPAREILTNERLAINFISKLSGIATTTHEFVKQIKPYRCQLLATRKTTPIWRDLEKYAVECGGGHTHRHGLFDQYMLKDNHKEVMRLMGHRFSRVSAFKIRERRKKNVPFITEVDSIREIPWALSFRPDMILLDNFTVSELRKAIQFVRELTKERKASRPLLEASGGITLENAREIVKAGVDRISVGAITHSPRAIDFSLEVTMQTRDQ